jgi:hypothetical protein
MMRGEFETTSGNVAVLRRSDSSRDTSLDTFSGTSKISFAARGKASVTIFVFAWLFVGFVSAYDAFLIVKYQHYLCELELNPMGRWLMELDDYHPMSDPTGVARFLGYKFAGTILVLGSMSLIYWRSERMGLTVVAALATFQALLAAFLTCW